MSRVQHMVVVKFKPGGDKHVERLFRELGELRKTIPGIVHYSAGKYASPEGANQGYTHGFLITFESAAARDAYLPHPDHERVKQWILPLVEAVMAFDFEE